MLLSTLKPQIQSHILVFVIAYSCNAQLIIHYIFFYGYCSIGVIIHAWLLYLGDCFIRVFSAGLQVHMIEQGAHHSIENRYYRISRKPWQEKTSSNLVI